MRAAVGIPQAERGITSRLKHDARLVRRGMAAHRPLSRRRCAARAASLSQPGVPSAQAQTTSG